MNSMPHCGRWLRRSLLPLFLLPGVLLAGRQLVSAASWSVVSPDSRLKMTVTSSVKEGPLSYRVEQGAEGSRVEVIRESPLGLRLQKQDFAEALQFVQALPPRVVEESYTMPHGKKLICHNRANEQVLLFRNPAGLPLALHVRVFDNGVAFRYGLPTGLEGTQTLEAEATGFALPIDAKLWCAPSDKATTYSPAYEVYYENEIAAGTPSPTGLGWSFPLLFRMADSRHWALITEANLNASFCGCRLSSRPEGGLYRVTLPQPAEGNGQGSVQPSSTLPWEMPWRVIMVGESLAAIVESTLVDDLSEPSRLKETDWIRPGRVAWSWWSDNPSPKDGAKQKKFVELAVEMGWEYMLVDANWTIMDNGTIHDVMRYAKSKGVGVLLWYNSGGPHNVVTEKPRDCLTYPEVRKHELNLLHEWGVKGIKVDFFQSDKQDVIGLYQGIMQDAAEQKIMVDFHGCTLPRGWQRTYPNLMSMEGVRGEECYIFDPQYPERAPSQNTILPFTRNVVGPMDYTPVGFSDNRYPHLTTWAHELALCVLFESGLLHFTDKAEAYLSLPDAPKDFIKHVPVAWDETRFVDGYPGKFAVLARRKGNTWYVAGVNGENRPREIRVDSKGWLPDGRFDLTTITDGGDGHSFKSATGPTETASGFTVNTLPRGGFVAVLKPAK